MRLKLLLIGLIIFLSSCAQQKTSTDGFLPSDIENLENTAAPGQGMSSWTAQTEAITGADIVGITDVSDTTQSDNGSSKKATMTQLGTFMGTLFAPIGTGDDLGSATASTIASLFTGTTGWLNADGTISTPSGTVPDGTDGQYLGYVGTVPTALDSVLIDVVTDGDLIFDAPSGKLALPTKITGGTYTNPVITVNSKGITTGIIGGENSGALEITEQVEAPVAAEMVAGELITATSTGSLYYKSPTGLYTFAGGYALNTEDVFPAGTYALYATQSTSQGANFIKNDTDIPDGQLTFYFRDKILLESAIAGLNSGSYVKIVEFGGIRGGYTGIIIHNMDGVNYLKLTLYNNANSTAMATLGAPITLGQAHTVEFYGLNSDPSPWEFRVDGVTIDSQANYPTVDMSVQLNSISIGSEITSSTIPGHTLWTFGDAKVYHDCVDISYTDWLGTDCSNTGTFSETFEASEYDLAGWVETLTGTLNGDSTGPL